MIGLKTMAKIENEINGLMNNYRPEISKVFDETGEIAISLKVKVVLKDGQNLIQTKISFVESKIEDGRLSSVDEKQGSLFGDNTPKSVKVVKEGE